jgi:hypothetical protein
MIGTAKIESKVKAEDAKIRKIEKTDWDEGFKAAKKFRVELTCLAVGIVLTIGISFLHGTIEHFTLAFPMLPNAIQIVIERLYKL